MININIDNTKLLENIEVFKETDITPIKPLEEENPTVTLQLAKQDKINKIINIIISKTFEKIEAQKKDKLTRLLKMATIFDSEGQSTLKEFICYRFFLVHVYTKSFRSEYESIRESVGNKLLSTPFSISDEEWANITKDLANENELDPFQKLLISAKFKNFNPKFMISIIKNLLKPAYISYLDCPLNELINLNPIDKIEALELIENDLLMTEDFLKILLIKPYGRTKKRLSILPSIRELLKMVIIKINDLYYIDSFKLIKNERIWKRLNEYISPEALMTCTVLSLSLPNKQLTKTVTELKKLTDWKKQNEAKVDKEILYLEYINKKMTVLISFRRHFQSTYSKLDKYLHALTWLYIYLSIDPKHLAKAHLLEEINEFLKTTTLAPLEFQSYLTHFIHSIHPYQSIENRLEETLNIYNLNKNDFNSNQYNLIDSIYKIRIGLHSLYCHSEGAFIPSLWGLYRGLKPIIDQNSVNFIDQHSIQISELNNLLRWIEPSKSIEGAKQKRKKIKDVQTINESSTIQANQKSLSRDKTTDTKKEEQIVVSSVNEPSKKINSFSLQLSSTMNELQKTLDFLTLLAQHSDHFNKDKIPLHFQNALFHLNLLKAYNHLLENATPSSLLISQVLGHGLTHLSTEQTLRGIEAYQNDENLWESILKDSRHNLSVIYSHCHFKTKPQSILLQNSLGSVWIRYPYSHSHQIQPISLKLQAMHHDYLIYLKQTGDKETDLFELEKLSSFQSYAYTIVQQAYYILSKLTNFLITEESSIDIENERKKLSLSTLYHKVGKLILKLDTFLSQEPKEKSLQICVKNAQFHLTLLHSLISLFPHPDEKLQALVSYALVFFTHPALEQLILAIGYHTKQINSDEASNLRDHHFPKLIQACLKDNMLEMTDHAFLKKFSPIITQIRYPFYTYYSGYHEQFNQKFLKLITQIASSDKEMVSLDIPDINVMDLKKTQNTVKEMKNLVSGTLKFYQNFYQKTFDLIYK
jgi:hypothetical protein